MDSLEDKIGYKFANSLLLAEALTHPSLAYERKKPHFDNQRLEYLGDAVIQLILTTKLYHRFPDFGEGKLTKLRSRLVSRDGLCEFAARIELGKHLLLGKGEDSSGGRERPSNLADAIEALSGAIYLDGGLEAATGFIVDNFQCVIDEIASQPEENNPKGELQENLQSITSNSPTYAIISQKGPDHQKLFVSEVSWEGETLGRGSGNSKKEAEMEAAVDALRDRKWESITIGE